MLLSTTVQRFFALAFLAGFTCLGTAADFDHTHATFDRLLKAQVHDGLVDYSALKANPSPLNGYLNTLAAVRESDFTTWTEKEQLAFLINLYNATTLKLITDHYPVESIKDIGSFFKSPWDLKVVRLFGRTFTLNELEYKRIRTDYQEPRVHFALVCAARGCPPLRSEAYVANRLDEQLDDQARRFLANTSKNRVEAAKHIVCLSPIFKWYGEDFEKQSGTVLKFLQPYWPARERAALIPGDFKIRYTHYDWSLNDLTK